MSFVGLSAAVSCLTAHITLVCGVAALLVGCYVASCSPPVCSPGCNAHYLRRNASIWGGGAPGVDVWVGHPLADSAL